jgi:hypothetical protein
MMKHQLPTNGASQAAIFARVWDTEDGIIPGNVARFIARLEFSKQDQARMHELAAKNQDGRLTPAELEELDNFVTVGDLLALLQSKARRVLKKNKTSPARHG